MTEPPLTAEGIVGLQGRNVIAWAEASLRAKAQGSVARPTSPERAKQFLLRGISSRRRKPFPKIQALQHRQDSHSRHLRTYDRRNFTKKRGRKSKAFFFPMASSHLFPSTPMLFHPPGGSPVLVPFFHSILHGLLLTPLRELY